MGSFEENMRRHARNLQNIAHSDELHYIKESVCQALRELAEAEDHGKEVEAISLDEGDHLLRMAVYAVRFKSNDDQRAASARELDPAWLRGFTVIPPTPDEDDRDEYADNPRQLLYGWAERKILTQVLAQATDYDGVPTPTSFDPAWIRGMRNTAIREEVVEQKKPVQLVIRRSDRGWIVYFRATEIFSQSQAAFAAVFDESFLKDELDAALAALLPPARAIGVTVYRKDQLAQRIERRPVGLLTPGMCRRTILKAKMVLISPRFPSRAEYQEVLDGLVRAVARAIEAIAAEPDMIYDHAQRFASKGRALGDQINQSELEKLVGQLDGAYELVNTAKVRCREALAPVNNLLLALQSHLQ